MSRRDSPVAINFASTDYPLLERYRWSLIGAVIAVAVLIMVMLGMVRSYRGQMSGIARQIKDLASSEEKLRPAMQERQRLIANLGEMSKLVDARRFSWVRLLTTIEDAFPAGVALAKLEFDPRERAIILEGSAHSPEALSKLMIGLQQAPQLKNPLLKRQSMEKGILAFHVTVSYQETFSTGQVQAPARRTGK